LTGISDWREDLTDIKFWLTANIDWEEVLTDRKCWLRGSSVWGSADLQDLLFGRKFRLTGSSGWQEISRMPVLCIWSAVIAAGSKHVGTCWSRDTWRQTARRKHRPHWQWLYNCRHHTATLHWRRSTSRNLPYLSHCLLLLKMQSALFTPRRRIRGAEVQLLSHL